ncbi:unnamed protein product [Gadus morhua 'NCC']
MDSKGALLERTEQHSGPECSYRNNPAKDSSHVNHLSRHYPSGKERKWVDQPLSVPPEQAWEQPAQCVCTLGQACKAAGPIWF